MSTSNSEIQIEGRQALEILKQQPETPFLVKFVAPYCPSCETLTPLLQKLVADCGGRVNLVTIDSTEDPDLAIEMGVRSVPTTIVFKGEAIIQRIVGLKPKQVYNDAIQQVL